MSGHFKMNQKCGLIKMVPGARLQEQHLRPGWSKSRAEFKSPFYSILGKSWYLGNNLTYGNLLQMALIINVNFLKVAWSELTKCTIGLEKIKALVKYSSPLVELWGPFIHPGLVEVKPYRLYLWQNSSGIMNTKRTYAAKSDRWYWFCSIQQIRYFSPVII